MPSSFLAENNAPNPIDTAEELIHDRDWLCDRPVEEEILAEVKGDWCDYRIWFTWQAELDVLIFSCAIDAKIPESQHAALYPMIAQMNQKLWLGHFELCAEEGIITFRHALLLRGTAGASPEQLEDVIDIAVMECDRFYPAFQSVLWGGRTIKDAVDIAMLEPVGEA